MNRMIAKGDAELMMRAGLFMSAIAGLVTDDLEEQDCDGSPFLDSFRLHGLMMGLKIAGQQLCGRSEDVTELFEKEEAKEKEKLEGGRTQ